MKYKVSIFFIIGFTLYLIDVALNNYDDKEIYISDQEIISLVTAWKSQVGRNPNDDEITRIINNLVDEEILYREALNLGLDKEDRIIKRRLAQKISFLKQESIPGSPSNQDLIDYFNENNDKYFIDPSFTFSHYFFSLENGSYKRASKAYRDLLNNIEIDSDPFFLGKNFVDLSASKIETEFGEDFSANFNNVELNEWIGPIKSPFGHHIIYVTNFTEGYLPDITNVLKQVEVDFLQDQRDKAIENYLNQIRSEYKIYINPELQI